ncbi:TPA: hypothetical protein MIT69_27895 [Klebsiella pneumoniae]|uniref:Uncharacterized protein n=1 Tax=Enterobacter roggenkampii TaxID=1812935 RepID=A0A837LBU5_9ENTR|nr:hypothetical protein AV984_24720 [Salmonella enterica subsp. enterica serovar Senftenberg str. 361154004]KJM36650.1 hypothetical protein SS27_10620 [Enterobacter kobei]KLP97750.1 hypothetical protein ABF77_16620 [Enterobacter roggenkampii]PSF19353.1 hypothetical protein C6985_27485 [Escherichia coli]HBY4049731.1 hypothetical protein [Klebsiella pneumoniae]HCD14457.1 hypothetical protein [Shewanella sp.]
MPRPAGFDSNIFHLGMLSNGTGSRWADSQAQAWSYCLFSISMFLSLFLVLKYRFIGVKNVMDEFLTSLLLLNFQK